MLHWFGAKALEPARTGQRPASATAPADSEPYGAVTTASLLHRVERMANLGFWRYELAGGRVFSSPQLNEIFGWPPAPHIPVGQALGHVMQPYRDLLEQALERAARHGEAYQMEVDILAADGRQKRLACVGEPEYRGSRIVALVGLSQDITRRHQMEQDLRQAATTDALTGIANRRQLELVYRDWRLDDDGEPAGEGFALVLADLDHFKTVNDARGHAVGDAVLVEVGRRLSASHLADCFAARLAGDEFVLLVTGAERLAALDALCEGLLHDLRQPLEWNGTSVPLSATIGVAVAERRGPTLAQMLECADAALYVAKNTGRGSAAITTRASLFLPDGLGAPGGEAEG